MLNLHPAGNMQGVEKPIGRYMRVGEASNGKDTMTGHWEMMGIKTEKPFKTFTDTGFPPELIAELEKRCGKRVIGNKSASGTEIIEEAWGRRNPYRCHDRVYFSRLCSSDLRK